MIIARRIIFVLLSLPFFLSCRNSKPTVIGRWQVAHFSYDSATSQYLELSPLEQQRILERVNKSPGLIFTFNKDSSYFTEKDGNRTPNKGFNFRFKSNGIDELYLIALEDTPPLVAKILLLSHDSLQLEVIRDGTVYYLRKID